MSLLTILIITLISTPSLSHSSPITIYDTTEICRTLKERNFTCYPDDSQFKVNLKNSYVNLMVNFEEKLIQLECHQQRTVNLANLINFPQLNLSDFTKLTFSNCYLGDSSFFSNLTEKLNLRNLKSLELDLKIEKTKKISQEIFTGLESAQEMKLKTHRNHTFDSNSLSKLERLLALEVHVHDLMDPPISPYLFNELRKLKKLWIFSTGGSHKRQEIKMFELFISDYLSLEEFKLEGVRWAFEVNLKVPRTLHEFTMRNNQKYTNADENSFRRFEMVEKMDLSNNSIDELHSRVFWSLKQVESIDLSSNLLRELNEEVFEKNAGLEVLDLSNNRLKTLGIKLFKNLENLRVLKIDNNFLTELYLTNNFKGTPELEILSLSNNLIKKIQQEMPPSKLTQIDLSNNNISHFQLSNFMKNSENSSDLKISLANNFLDNLDFRSIDEDEIGEDQTVTIDVGDTPMTCNCDTTNFYEFLMKKFFKRAETYEKIRVVPEDVQCRYGESVIGVAEMDRENIWCPLDTKFKIVCPTSCRCLRKPVEKTLTIQCNNITEVPILPFYNLIDSLETIKLKIRGNNLISLPVNPTSAYNNVTEIDASFNSIFNLDAKSLPENLKIIDLRMNALTTLNPDVLTRFSTMDRILLSGNPWNCSKSKDLIEFVKTHRNIIFDFNQIRCQGNQKFFLEFDFETSCAIYVYITLVLFTLSIFFGCSIFFYCKNRRVISEWIFVNDKKHIVEKTKDLLMPKKFDICLVMTPFDKIVTKYIGDRLKAKPNEFKCAFVTKNWSSGEEIPIQVLQTFKNSRRVAIILSEYFEEEIWMRWCYANIQTRLILIVKGSTIANEIKLNNKMVVRFNDPWFWDKLKYAIEHRRELEIGMGEEEDVELRLLNEV